MSSRLLILSCAALLVAAVPAAARVSLEDDGYHLDFEGDTLVVEGGRHSETVEITADLELSIDGERVKVDRGDRRLLKAYYEKAEDLVDEAEELGREGAKLGARGAAVGVRAVASVLRLLSDDYDADDLEADIDAETEFIEIDAAKIEAAGKRLEEKLDDLRDIGDDLQRKVPELKDLDWF